MSSCLVFIVDTVFSLLGVPVLQLLLLFITFMYFQSSKTSSLSSVIFLVNLMMGCLLVQLSAEWPYVFIQASIYSVIVYATLKFDWTPEKFLVDFYFLFLTLLYFTYWGMTAVSITPNSQVAAITSSAFYSLWNLFAGFTISRKVFLHP